MTRAAEQAKLEFFSFQPLSTFMQIKHLSLKNSRFSLTTSIEKAPSLVGLHQPLPSNLCKAAGKPRLRARRKFLRPRQSSGASISSLSVTAIAVPPEPAGVEIRKSPIARGTRQTRGSRLGVGELHRRAFPSSNARTIGAHPTPAP